MSHMIGRIVHYILTDDDAATINVRRSDFQAYQRTNDIPDRRPGQPPITGHVGHVGNAVVAGQVYPAMVVEVFDPAAAGWVNLQVFLDGADTYWATSRVEGTEAGRWSWPPR